MESMASMETMEFMESNVSMDYMDSMASQLTVFGFSQLFKPGTLNYDIWGSRADIFVNGSIII